ncbi:MAG: circadian clock protein KaiC [Leptolyngbyaceae cyanobacterium bins.59]|nr:circadian clock protein KaiC [Leptolyngbyaceae cyanobacterium bins.59]
MNTSTSKNVLPKCPTGVRGLDEITDGGLPKGRPTLICGSAGCGKTLLGMEFLVRGATLYDEPGVFVAFEETAEELTQNVASLGWDLEHLIQEKKLAIDHIAIDPQEIHETGDYDLEGLFIRLGAAIQSVGAKRIVLDTIEVLFTSLSNSAIIRSELQRLFRWLKAQGVTTIITGERGEKTLTRQGLEEYVSDCVIRLDQRLNEELATRRLQILKYRGSSHGTNEYPFLIEEDGISVLPITSVKLDHSVSDDRISSGIPQLDAMLGGQGFYRGSSILITGTAGTGKSTISAHVAYAACLRGERCLYLALEEAPQQILRNMRSVNLDLEPFVERGLLHFKAVRPTAYGLEMHLVKIFSWLQTYQVTTVIMDPMSNLSLSGTLNQARTFFIRLIDFLKAEHITVLLTNLTAGGSPLEQTEIGVSSLIDTWLELRTLERSGERNRVLYILKSRGMEHSNQVREFSLSRQGIELREAYIGQGEVLTGSARLAQEVKERQTVLARQHEFERKQREFERKQAIVQAQMAALQAQLQAEEEELRLMQKQEELYHQNLIVEQEAMAYSRKAEHITFNSDLS